MFCEKKAGKECVTATEEGWRAAQTGHKKKKPHSFERTHILDSKVALTHHKRNDAGRERRGKREGKKKNIFSEVMCFSLAAPLLLYLAVYKQSNKCLNE